MIKKSRVEYSKQFRKQLKKAPIEIKEAFLRRRELFSADSLNPLLNNHALTGEHLGKRSINVTGDWRAIYSEEKMKKVKKLSLSIYWEPTASFMASVALKLAKFEKNSYN